MMFHRPQPNVKSKSHDCIWFLADEHFEGGGVYIEGQLPEDQVDSEKL